jgi:hypothetical protein
MIQKKENYITVYKAICRETNTSPRNIENVSIPWLLDYINKLLIKNDCHAYSDYEIFTITRSIKN